MRDPKIEADIEEVERLSTLLDSQFRIPGTSVRFGWDTVLGLVPGLGDLVTLAPAGYLIYKARKLGARKRVIGRMALNSGLDVGIGLVPVLGDVFDMFFKANNRNAALLRREMERRRTL